MREQEKLNYIFSSKMLICPVCHCVNLEGNMFLKMEKLFNYEGSV